MPTRQNQGCSSIGNRAVNVENYRESKRIGIERLRVPDAQCAIQHQTLAVVNLVRTAN